MYPNELISPPAEVSSSFLISQEVWMFHHNQQPTKPPFTCVSTTIHTLTVSPCTTDITTTTTMSAGTDFDTAVAALYSELHQSQTRETIQAAAARRKDTIAEMRTYLGRLGLLPFPSSVRVVHVTGTKGKGSTACLVESILRTAYGQRTGLFTSPHLVDITERIRIGGRPVSQQVFGQAYWQVRKRLEQHGAEHCSNDDNNGLPVLPGYFRMLTLVAFFIFVHYDPGLDVIILEVGMGGRYDATNVLDSTDRISACGITKLDLDHTRILGDTLEKIAWEKGGIFLKDKTSASNDATDNKSDNTHYNSSTVFALDPRIESVTQVLQHCAAGHTLELLCGPEYQRRIPADKPIGLPGKHQRDNAEVALALSEYVMQKPSNDEALHKALASAAWPGRCQTVSVEKMTLRLDGAHTVESVMAGLTWFRDAAVTGDTGNIRRSLLFNCSHERNPVELLELLVPLNFHSVYFCRADSERPSAIRKKTAAEYLQDRKVPFSEKQQENPTWQDTLCAIWKHLQLERSSSSSSIVEANLNVKTALGRIQDEKYTGRREILVTGSLYLVGSALTAVNWSELKADGRLKL